MHSIAGTSTPLAGERLDTLRWEDCRHWIAIYGDLLRFKSSVLGRVHTAILRLREEAREAAQVDITFIEDQMKGYEDRLELWYERLWDLQGLWIDPEGDVVRYAGREVALTKRERQLLQFLLDHPHRYLTTTDIVSGAWGEPSLLPEEVRNYIQRLRKLLSTLKVPCRVDNRPGKGYALVISEPRRTAPASS